MTSLFDYLISLAGGSITFGLRTCNKREWMSVWESLTLNNTSITCKETLNPNLLSLYRLAKLTAINRVALSIYSIDRSQFGSQIFLCVDTFPSWLKKPEVSTRTSLSNIYGFSGQERQRGTSLSSKLNFAENLFNKMAAKFSLKQNKAVKALIRHTEKFLIMKNNIKEELSNKTSRIL